MIDEERVRRIILDDMRKCVTACRLENQTLKIRVRSWAIPTRFGNVVYSVQDVRLPIPPGHRDEAIELVRAFNGNIVAMNKKVVSVMPYSLQNGLISETNF